MDDFLPKPVLSPDLESLLARYLPAAQPPPVPEKPQPIGEPPFDLSALADRIGDAPEILSEFARLFLAETSRLLAACHEALLQRDGMALGRAAHALRGLLMNLESGRDALQAIALTRLLEQRGQVEGLHGAAHLLTTIELRLTRITAYLRSSVLGEPDMS
jgi:HPt (histidine-containing phosphotransfer) domain-containing protein